MSINKNALIRYQTLDKCFRNTGRTYQFNDLLEACNKALVYDNPNSDGVRRRQVYDDISFMESASGWSIELEKVKEGRKVYYRYADPNFSINNQPLNELEAEQLRTALLVLNRFKGLPQLNWTQELSTRLEQTFQLDNNSKQVIEFEENPYLLGLEYMTDLYVAITQKQVLEIQYQSFTKKRPSTLELHPYYLKQYNNRWFLFGYNTAVNGLTNVALDRIQAISTPKETVYIENNQYDFETYFEDIVGVTVLEKEELTKIQLQIDADLWPYIKSKPLHGSQKIQLEHKDYTLVDIEVIPNYELESLLFSYGEKLQILEPKTLKTKLLKRARKMVSKEGVATNQLELF